MSEILADGEQPPRESRVYQPTKAELIALFSGPGAAGPEGLAGSQPTPARLSLEERVQRLEDALQCQQAAIKAYVDLKNAELKAELQRDLSNRDMSNNRLYG